MNKIIFSGLMILVCCLFGGVEVVNGEMDIGWQDIPMTISNGESITPNDICRAAGYGHCKSVDGVENLIDITGFDWDPVLPVVTVDCDNGTIATGDRVKARVAGSLVCDLRGWGALSPPKNVPDDFREAVMNATNWLLGFVSMLAVLMIIWGGINYLTAAGDEEKARTAKKIITYGIIGVVIAGLAYAIVTVIVTVILK